MGKTKLQTKRTVNRPWLSSVKNDICQVKCIACGDAINITSGIGAVKNHENTPKHLRNFNNNKNQLQFVVKEKVTVSMKSVDKSVILTTEEQEWKAEILRALNVVDKNHSSELYKCFPILKSPRITKCRRLK